MGTCHGSNKFSNETLNYEENLEIFSLIWLDDTIEKYPKIITIQQEFRMIINYMKIFENLNDCEEYLKNILKDEFVIFIVNDRLGEKILPNIHHLSQIFSIYIYSLNKNIDQSWINQFNKIKSIRGNYEEILNEIKIDYSKNKHIENDILFDIFHVENSNDNFVYSQIFLDVLLDLDSLINDMVDFISLCRNQYKGNKSQLNIVREFQKNYSSNQAIWWLTRDIFLSQLLNKALRVKNIDLMFLLRFFIHDIEKQLSENQCLSTIKVYRFQLIPNGELETIRNSIGQFISINNFLLTNMNRDSVLSRTQLLLNNNDFQPVLFEITAEPTIEKIRPFANITSLKYSNNDQDEVLFMLGSIFQLNTIRQDENDVWIIELTLSHKNIPELKSTFDTYKNDNNDDTNLLSFGYILQKQNKINETEKYFLRLMEELPDDDERLAYCCFNLGNLSFTKTNYDSSLEWLLKSLDISLRTLQPNDPFFAQIYNSMGHVYNAKNDSKTAIDYYNKSIIIWKQTIDINYMNIAECMNNIGIIYKQEKSYITALECFKKTLIILEKYLSNDHFDLSKSHCNLASTYRQLGDYDLALHHYNLSYEILQKHYSADHPNIAKALGNIGIVYALNGDRQSALSYYEKAAEIYQRTLPSTHVNNIKINQLIRSISSPNRRISFGLIEIK